MCVRETLSLAELCALFHRNPALSRNFALADSQEYLALLLWIVDSQSEGDDQKVTWIPRGLIAFVILVVVIFVLNALNLIHIHGSVSI